MRLFNTLLIVYFSVRYQTNQRKGVFPEPSKFPSNTLNINTIRVDIVILRYYLFDSLLRNQPNLGHIGNKNK